MKTAKKFIEKLVEDQYITALQAATDMGLSDAAPAGTAIVSAFLSLPEKTQNTVQKFSKPKLLIVPATPFDEKIKDIDAWTWNGGESPYRAVETPKTHTVSIVDGAQTMPHIDGISVDSRWDIRRDFFQKHLKKIGVRMIDVHEYAVLACLSGEDPIDWDSRTCLSIRYLAKSALVAFSDFSPGARLVSFDAHVPEFQNADLRGRPSAQVLEF